MSHAPHACFSHVGKRGRSFVRSATPAARILSRTPVSSGAFTGSRVVFPFLVEVQHLDEVGA